MEAFKVYIIKNFILICLSIVLYINSILRYKQHKRISQCVIGITSIALYLSIGNAISDFTKAQSNIIATTIISVIGYTIRPGCLFLFILMSGFKPKKKSFFLLYLPLIINAIIYLFAFIPATKYAVFGFEPNSSGGISFFGGPLRFSSHIISGLYLIFLLYISFKQLRGKHISHGLSLLLCSLFVVASVIIESFFSDDGSIDHLLNNTIVASTVVYYLFLYTEKAQLDVLTGLFNRETFYADIKRMEKSITAVVQFDMNGLKYINDNFGHVEGDRALSTIANIFYNNATRKMYVYRLGGDEFTMLALNTTEEELKEVLNKIKEDINEVDYFCSMGYAYRNDSSVSMDDLLKEAEEKMYIDKANFYKTAKFDRRKADQI